MAVPGKVPPYSIEAEQGVLGSLLVDREGMTRVADLIAPDDFYDSNHARVYEAMVFLYGKNKPIDLLTVREVLDDRGHLAEMGGSPFLAALTNAVPTSANVYQYAQIVKHKAVLRRLLRCGSDIVALGYDEATELPIVLEKAEKSLFTVTQTFIKNKLTHIRDVLSGRYDEYAEIHENPKAAHEGRVQTGFRSLDHKLQGLRGGDMVIIAARPSMGKTAFALNIAQNVGFTGRHVAIFSLEMSKEQLADRLVCSSMGIDSWKLQKGELTDAEFSLIGDALAKLSRSNIYIDDSAAMGLMEIKSKCRRLKMESRLDIILIDYLQLMSSGTSTGNNFNRVQEISEISRGIKMLARELDVPVVALSQLSRAVESRTTKEPILSDLRESGSIEQDADIVMMMYRGDYYQDMGENDINKGLTSIFVRKNRNGPIGQVDLKFDSQYMKFREIEGTREGF